MFRFERPGSSLGVQAHFGFHLFSYSLSDSSTSILSHRSTSYFATSLLRLSSRYPRGHHANPESKMNASRSPHVDSILTRLPMCMYRLKAVFGKAMSGKGTGWRYIEQDRLLLSQFFVQKLHRTRPQRRPTAGLSACCRLLLLLLWTRGRSVLERLFACH